ncbi:MAG: MFS transporter, partial [Candidatus Lindowbacteria bacterium]|nr:MFS transporter [Candidatus Lindowbacteria bacterium]
MEKNKKALFAVFLVVLVDLMGLGIIIPLLPLYAQRFESSPLVISMLFSVYAFAQLIFSPILGSMSDKFGRRPIMLVSTFGAAIAYTVFGLADSLQLLFVSRIIAGVMGGNISTAQAYVADVTTEENRARGMGMIGAAFGIGFAAGPAFTAALLNETTRETFVGLIGGGFSEWVMANTFALPGFFAAGLSSLSFLLVLFYLPETIDSTKSHKDRKIRAGVFSASFWKFVFQKRESVVPNLFPMTLLCIFLVTFSEANLYVVFPLFCSNQLGLSAEQISIQYIILGGVAVFTQGVMIRPLLKYYSEELLFFGGTFFIIGGLILLPFASSERTLTMFLSILTIGTGISRPMLQSMLSKQVDPSKYGETMGASQGFAGIGRVIGPAWGGKLYGFAYGLPFFATAATLSISTIIGARLLRA